MDITRALEALKEADQTSNRRQLAAERWPEAVAILDEWAKLRHDGSMVSMAAVARIIAEHTGRPINEYNVRNWVARYHPDLVNRGRR